MSKNAAAKVVDIAVIGKAEDASDSSDKKDEKQKTDKKILKQLEKVVRKMDNALTELHKVNADVGEFISSISAGSDYIDEKDEHRLNEIDAALQATVSTLYYTVHRMARKYVGKEIDSIDNNKRKSLKK